MKAIQKISAKEKSELVLENDTLRASFLPHDGGRLVSFVAQPTGREFIWTNARTTPLLRYHGADYDNLSAGGVEEAFPCAYADSFNGYVLPFFGEVWPICWDFESSPHGDGWLMRAYCSEYPVEVSKEWALLDDGLQCSYELTNLSGLTLPYLFGVHPSLRIEPGDMIHLPENAYETGAMFPENLTSQKTFEWPMLGKRDLRVPQSQTACEYLQIFTKKAGGTLSVASARDDVRLDISYDPSYFSAFSLWLLYGGWRGHYCLMSEFFTGWPLVLSQAVTAGTSACLKPWEKVQTRVFYRLHRLR